MSAQQQNHATPATPPTPAANPAGGTQLTQLGQQAAGFLEAASAIIDKALSTDSQAFLQANRQQGGQ